MTDKNEDRSSPGGEGSNGNQPEPSFRQGPPRRRRVRWWSVVTAVGSAVIGLAAYFYVQDGLKLVAPKDPAAGGFGLFPSVAVPAPPPAASVTPLPPNQRDPVVPVAVGESVDVADSGAVRTINCTGGSVTVSGADNTLLVSGDCARVDISGDRNVIRVTSVAAILVNGEDNQVTYFSGDPDINNTGFSNIVEPA